MSGRDATEWRHEPKVSGGLPLSEVEILESCLRDDDPESGAEIQQAFADGWIVESISRARFEANDETDRRLFRDGGPRAWFAVIRRG